MKMLVLPFPHLAAFLQLMLTAGSVISQPNPELGQEFGAASFVDYSLVYDDTTEYYSLIISNSKIARKLVYMATDSIGDDEFSDRVEVEFERGDKEIIVGPSRGLTLVFVKTDRGVTSFLFLRTEDGRVALLVNGAVRRRAEPEEPSKIIEETRNDVIAPESFWRWPRKEE